MGGKAVLAPKKTVPYASTFYRRLNTGTKRDAYLVPRIKVCVDSLVEVTFIFIPDAISGYWLVEIDKADRDKAKFMSRHKLYRFIRMLFGLRNALGTFQRLIDVNFSTRRKQYAPISLDNIVILFRSLQ